MSSANPYQIIDDDDEGFDWDAAARQIEVACQVTKPSTSLVGDPSSNSRQVTLDKFLGKKETPRPQLEDPKIGKNEQDYLAGDEGPNCIEVDAEAVKTWIYPVNVPRRDYQFAITKSAIFSNTLVALPTGLGKTLIAAVVMYNYFRWFPRGKIVFTAPSRPLVMQQIEACHNIVGIPQEWTIDMTGQLSPAKRACFWKTKRVFFVTPQVLEKDIHSGKCQVKYLVCLVIDEAHRAMGNYSYCEVVRELMDVPVQLRILALTATPGAKQQTVQQVIDNLHISQLEYRNENDPDVMSYVHKRKIELIEVAMGQDAVEINQQLLEVIRPIVGRLSALGVLKNRDYRTLSPCELLEIREKYRQAPPDDFSNVNNDVEGYFGVLISLYYIHKLLSSHGIRPAHEMLERKLKQGFFAKYMSKNEVFQKARMLMQQNLSHGAPSPKLSKMLEILWEHFKANDPQSSRVIIFSNYRESVRDIMDALGNIGEPIRATQFIGQSSGKTMKGQSQKVQQAVLQKFRSGAYNVIVATSIGEEGLDIMEVDLVVAFDANVSPLRMIQRMGRTGRKHDGQVVVLACEGTELKGYLRKQAKSKAISKHMRNGGINSFTFHPSPRMIPHVFKPEVQFVELSIEKFVSREKKVKDSSIQIDASIGKLTVDENNILAKYFPSNGENTWKPSLIAFPYIQTHPSRTHKVNHSCRAVMLIDLMQRLQGKESFLGNNITSNLQYGIEASNAVDLDKIDKVRSGIQTEDFVDLTSPDNPMGEQRSPTTSCIKKDDLPSSSFIDLDKNTEKSYEFEETVPDTPIAKTIMSNESDVGTPDFARFKTSLSPDDAFNDGINESQCSPRLTSLIKSGFVPESPIDEGDDFLPGLSRSQHVIRDRKPPVHLQMEEQIISSLGANEKVIIDDARDVHTVPIDPSNNETQTLLFERKNCAIRRGQIFSSPTVEEGHNPFADVTNRGFSEESPLCCGDVAESVKPARKFKRLRKADGAKRHRKEKRRKDHVVSTENLGKTSSTPDPTSKKHGQGRRKSIQDARVFIDDEAEVSSEADVSNDEDGEDYSSIDSFIDDRMNPTAATQSRASGIDMMAVYRRSLLSQLPVEGGATSSVTFSPYYVSSMTVISENGVSSGSIPRHLHTPQVEPTNHSDSKSLQSVEVNQIASESIPSSSFPYETTTHMRSRKRKLSFHRPGFPSANLEQEFALQSHEESTVACATKNIPCDDDIFDDIDLDELEAQAASLFKQKSDLSDQKQGTHAIPQSHLHDPHFSNPSFDLGI